MKLLFLVLLLASVLFVNVAPLFAQTPSATPAPHIQVTNEFTTDNDSNSVITIIKGFIQGFDTFMGGFIFYTPDPLSDKITLKDTSEIPGIIKYRDMFYQIAIPVLAIIISAVAITKIGSENAQELKSFGLRFLTTIVLFIIVPPALSYSIQANNLLVQRITTNQEFTGFMNNYLDKSQTAIEEGNNSEQYGIPQFHYSLIGGVLKFLGEFIVKLFLFALTFIFLLLGFLYIGFQFVIRFASLLFLGVIFPIIIPFMLAERTQHIVYTYFKSWFTLLIMQPAFVLGFAIATDIFTSILNAQGPSVGLLFFYTGFLFFLGGVNILVGRIFGSGWDAMATNMQAAIISRTITQPIHSNFRDFRRGLLGGSMSSLIGQKSAQKLRKTFHRNEEVDSFNGTEHSKSNGMRSSAISYVASHRNSNNSHVDKAGTSGFSEDLRKQGLQVQTVNQKQGIVSISGEAYRYADPKSGLTTLYPNRIEAIQDGVPERKLITTHLDKAQFIDLSSFNKHNQNPHNYNAMQESRKQGKELHYAHITSNSHPERVRSFLDMSRSRNDALGVQGVIIKRQGKQTGDNIIRLYTPYENRTHI